MTPASIAKHPIHPMIIPFPIALWVCSFLCDLIYFVGWGSVFWKDMAFFSMAGGVIGALLAAVPGYMDYRSLRMPHVQRIGLWHMIINLSIVMLFVINLWVRSVIEKESNWPILLSLIGVVMLSASGWLGGELVYVHGVGINPEAMESTHTMNKRDRAA